MEKNIKSRNSRQNCLKLNNETNIIHVHFGQTFTIFNGSLNFIISQVIIVIYSFWKAILFDFKKFDNLLFFIFLKIKTSFFCFKMFKNKNIKQK